MSKKTEPPPLPDLKITEDPNNPATVSWLDSCRKLDPCDDLTFRGRIPFLIKLGLRLQADARAKKLN